MTNKRYSRFKSEITGLFCIADENHKETFCGMDNEYNCMRIVNILNQKEERIKELTAQLQTDDSCSKCKHEYLVKQDDGYFIAKCKKGHNECSKEDIRFCEDFELSEDLLQ